MQVGDGLLPGLAECRRKARRQLVLAGHRLVLRHDVEEEGLRRRGGGQAARLSAAVVPATPPPRPRAAADNARAACRRTWQEQ